METTTAWRPATHRFDCRDDAAADALYSAWLGGVGFDAVDAGPLRNARLLESVGYLNIQLGYTMGMGREVGFKLLH